MLCFAVVPKRYFIMDGCLTGPEGKQQTHTQQMSRRDMALILYLAYGQGTELISYGKRRGPLM